MHIYIIELINVVEFKKKYYFFIFTNKYMKITKKYNNAKK